MGYFILAPVLLADCKSAIVTCTAADCKSAETGCKSEIGNWRRIANPPKLALFYHFMGTFSFLRRYLKRIANPK